LLLDAGLGHFAADFFNIRGDRQRIDFLELQPPAFGPVEELFDRSSVGVATKKSESREKSRLLRFTAILFSAYVNMCVPSSPLSARRFRSRAVVELENLALRHQLHVLRRQRPGRLRLITIDRLLWVWLYRLWPRCLDTMVLVKPATVVQWHRQGFRLFWRWHSRSGRPSVDREVRDLIRQMSVANPLWGAPRIHRELLKLGIEIS
jgi:hypothetical protein